MIRRYKLGSDVELHKRTLEMGELSLIGPDARRDRRRRRARRRTSTTTCAREIGGHPVVLVATDVGVDVFCDAERTEGVRGALLAAGAVEVGEAAAEVVRVERGRPRYGVDLDDSRDPAGGRPQRARRLVHQGLLRRPGDGRAAVLPRQAEPPPARAAAQRARRAGHRAAARREGGRPRRQRRSLSPAHGPIALALVRREAAPGDTLAAGEATAVEVAEASTPSRSEVQRGSDPLLSD